MKKCHGCDGEFYEPSSHNFCYKCRKEFKDKTPFERELLLQKRDMVYKLWDILWEMDSDELLDIINDTCMSNGCRCGGEDSYIEWS